MAFYVRSEMMDTDRDGISGDIDNCPDTANVDQADSDGDGIGDVCDNDYDDCTEEYNNGYADGYNEGYLDGDQVCQDDLTECEADNAACENNLTQCETDKETCEADINTMSDTLSILESDFQAIFDDSNFVIPGDSTSEKLSNLIDAIKDLNKGRKKGIYENLQ